VEKVPKFHTVTQEVYDFYREKAVKLEEEDGAADRPVRDSQLVIVLVKIKVVEGIYGYYASIGLRRSFSDTVDDFTESLPDGMIEEGGIFKVL
jgi:hypothetical protein